jgi:hypothetical protein
MHRSYEENVMPITQPLERARNNRDQQVRALTSERKIGWLTGVFQPN